MPKKFFTDKDIEELYHKGIKSLQMGDEVVLTDLAYEKAKRLGIHLTFGDQAEHPPAAPVRPYLSDKEPPPATPVTASAPQTPSQPRPSSSSVTDIEQRIRSAVIARLGNQVDAQLLENIIHRVVKATGLK
jgi:hypothetical protein